MSKSTKKSSKSSTVSNGLLLRGFRKQNKFSQAYIGEIVGKNKRTVSSYEVGRINMPSSVVSILNKKYKLGLTDVSVNSKRRKGSVTTMTDSGIKFRKASLNSSKSNSKTFRGRFINFVKSTGLSVSAFCEKYGLSVASTYRIINGVGQHYFSLEQIAKINKDTNFMKLVLG